jgi:phage shock protein PspC (stress-responsive transcriptional regulator)
MIVLTGVGLIAYIVAWVVIPEAPYSLPERSSAGSEGTIV